MKRRVVLLAVLGTIATLVAAVQSPVLQAQAVWIDDHQFVIRNPLVQDPGWSSARRFVSEVVEPSTVRGYYKPLTMISLMLDSGRATSPDDWRPYHLSNLTMHVATTCLLVVWLYLLCGNIWVAGLVGLLFGVHPLTVEPLAWIAGRKTMLSSLLVVAALVVYVGYVRTRSRALYGLCTLFFFCALLAKPTSTPLPVLLLVLDWWPLRRLSWRAVLEKVPLLVLAVASGVVTVISQARAAGITTPDEPGPFGVLLKLGHNIVFYLQKMFWPVDLALQYPVPRPLSLAHPAVLAGVVGTILLVSALLVLRRWWRAPLAGWLFWFVAILPAMGIVGVTYVIAADRYAYLPATGILLILAAGLVWLWDRGRTPRMRQISRAGMVVVVLGLVTAEAGLTRQQLAYWRDTEGLHRQALVQTPGAYSVRYNLALFLEERGRIDEAIAELRTVIRHAPDLERAHSNLGRLSLARGQMEVALRHYRVAVQLNPDAFETQYNLGVALQKNGDAAGAMAAYRAAIAADPARSAAHLNLGNVLLSQGDHAGAVRHYGEAIGLRRDYVLGYYNRGLALIQLGRNAEAVADFRRVLAIDPQHEGAQRQLATMEQRRGGG